MARINYYSSQLNEWTPKCLRRLSVPKRITLLSKRCCQEVRRLGEMAKCPVCMRPYWITAEKNQVFCPARHRCAVWQSYINLRTGWTQIPLFWQINQPLYILNILSVYLAVCLEFGFKTSGLVGNLVDGFPSGPLTSENKKWWKDSVYTSIHCLWTWIWLSVK